MSDYEILVRFISDSGTEHTVSLSDDTLGIESGEHPPHAVVRYGDAAVLCDPSVAHAIEALWGERTRLRGLQQARDRHPGMRFTYLGVLPDVSISLRGASTYAPASMPWWQFGLTDEQGDPLEDSVDSLIQHAFLHRRTTTERSDK